MAIRDYGVVRFRAEGSRSTRLVVVKVDEHDPDLWAEVASFLDTPAGRKQAAAYVHDVQQRQAILGGD